MATGASGASGASGNNTINVVIRAIDQTTNAINSINANLQGMTRNINRQTTKINNAFKSVGSTIRTAIGVAITFATGKIMKLGLEVGRISKKMNLVFEENSREVKQWAEGIQKALDIDATGLLKDVSTMGVFLKGFGVADRDLVKMSKSLALLVKDLSTLYGYSESEVTDKIISGLRGETKAIDDLGINLRARALDEIALSLGIKKHLAEMNSSERAYLTYIAIMRQSKFAQGQFLAQQDTSAAKFDRIKNKLVAISRTIGQVFVAAFNVVADSILGILDLIQNVLNKVAGSLNIKVGLNDSDFKSGEKSADKFADSLSDVSDSIDETGESAKKSKPNVASFDEVISLTNNSSDSKPKGGLFSNIEIPEINWGDIKQNNSKGAEESTKDIESKVKDGLQRVADTIDRAGKKITGDNNFTIGFDADRAVNDIKGILSHLKSIVKNAGSFIIELGFKLAGDLKIGAIFNEALSAINSFTYAVDEMIKAVTPALMAFYDTGLKPIVEWLGEKLVEALRFVSEEFNKFGDWFAEIAPDLQQFAVYAGEIVNVLWSLIEPIADTAWDIFRQVVSGILQCIRDLIGFLLQNGEATITILSGIGGAFAGIKIAGIIGQIGSFITTCGGVGPAVTTVVSSLVGPLTGALQGLWALLAANPVGAVIGAVAGLIAAGVALYNKCEPFRNFIDGLWDKIKSFGKWLADGFVGIIKGVGNAVGSFVGGIKAKISSVISTFKDIGTQLKAPLNFLIDMLNKLIDGINGLKINIPDCVPIVGGQSWGIDIPNIPRLATGGITNGSILANIGEKGREAVLPLENNLGYLSEFAQVIANTIAPMINKPGTGITIKADNIISTNQSIEELARIIVNIIQKRGLL